MYDIASISSWTMVAEEAASYKEGWGVQQDADRPVLHDSSLPENYRFVTGSQMSTMCFFFGC
jgi:hypothetical protein